MGTWILFVLTLGFLVGELVHMVLHGMVLFRTNLMNYEELKDHQWYFVLDLIGIVGSYMILKEKFRSRWLFLAVTFHTTLHLFYLLTWEQGYFADRIQRWSTQEYMCQAGAWITWDWFLTLYDIGIHGIMSYLLWRVFAK